MVGGPTVSQIAAPSPPITGGLYRAPLGTALPTDTTTALNVAFTSLGYVDDDGVTLKIDRPNTRQYAWGGKLVAALQEHYGASFTFKLYQILDPDVLMAVHSDTNVTVTPPTSTVGTLTTTALNDKLNVNSAWVVAGFYQLTGIRWAIPKARITQVGDIKITHKSLATMDCTLETFPDDSGNFIYQITDDGVHT
jgi:hypothetical protein